MHQTLMYHTCRCAISSTAVSLFVYSLVGGGTHDTYFPPKKQLNRRGYSMKSHSAADARQNQLQKKILQALFHRRCPSQSHERSARGRTSDDSYIYQLSLVVATATVSFFFECTRPAASMRPPCLICLSTNIRRLAGAAIYHR